MWFVLERRRSLKHWSRCDLLQFYKLLVRIDVGMTSCFLQLISFHWMSADVNAYMHFCRRENCLCDHFVFMYFTTVGKICFSFCSGFASIDLFFSSFLFVCFFSPFPRGGGKCWYTKNHSWIKYQELFTNKPIQLILPSRKDVSEDCPVSSHHGSWHVYTSCILHQGILHSFIG